jgi:hypothetical protein
MNGTEEAFLFYLSGRHFLLHNQRQYAFLIPTPEFASMFHPHPVSYL